MYVRVGPSSRMGKQLLVLRDLEAYDRSIPAYGETTLRLFVTGVILHYSMSKTSASGEARTLMLVKKSTDI